MTPLALQFSDTPEIALTHDSGFLCPAARGLIYSPTMGVYVYLESLANKARYTRKLMCIPSGYRSSIQTLRKHDQRKVRRSHLALLASIPEPTPTYVSEHPFARQVSVSARSTDHVSIVKNIFLSIGNGFEIIIIRHWPGLMKSAKSPAGNIFQKKSVIQFD